MAEEKIDKPKRPNGRPPKLVESEELLKQIEGLARIQCTQREAAAVLRVDEDTFNKFLGSNNNARTAWKMGQESGKASLRRMQFKSAENGNVTSQIWLGKQWLDQKDKAENTVNINKFEQMTDEQLRSQFAAALRDAAALGIDLGAGGVASPDQPAEAKPAGSISPLH